MRHGWADILRTFLRIGLLSFGGPAGQIATMHRVLVDEKKWLDESRFLHALNFCMLLPGPEAQQLATYAGWRVAGIPGGVAAGGLFVLPGFLVMLALAALYVGFHQVPVVQGLFLGLKPAVLALATLLLMTLNSWLTARRPLSPILKDMFRSYLVTPTCQTGRR